MIDIINTSEYPIGYYFATGGIYGTYYPDSLPERNDYIVYDMRVELRSGLGSWLSWEQFFNNLPKDTLSLFIFHTDTLTKYSWEEIRREYKILRRYDLSIEDIHRLKNKYDVPKIPYPPTEIMKNMKMYPPYEK
jgi:hypothetical protein